MQRIRVLDPTAAPPDVDADPGPPAAKLGGKTVATIGRMLPEQHKYLVFVRGHVLAISGGEVHDWTAGRKHRVNQVLRIEKDS